LGEIAIAEIVELEARVLSDVVCTTAAQPEKIKAIKMMAAEIATDLLTIPRGTVVINVLFGYKALIFRRFRGAGGRAPQAKFTERVGFQQLVRRPV